MSAAFWCVLVAGLLPYVATVIAKSDKSFNNADPRAWLARQSGFRQRANAAQANSFEVFPLFAAAVIIAQYLHAPQPRIDMLAFIFIAARVLYLLAYLADQATLRSLCWFAGLASVVGLFVISA